MRILLIGSDLNFIQVLKTHVKQGYIVDTALTGTEGVYYAEVNDYDAILVDSFLTDIDGTEVCRMTKAVRQEVPLIFLSDPNNINSKILSLDSGADACLVKPIEMPELLAQLRSVIRRNITSYKDNLLRVGVIEMDIKKREVKIGMHQLSLRRKEFDLLEYLMCHSKRKVSKEEILEHVWDQGLEIPSNTLEVHIKFLRDKFQKYCGRNFIKTVRGFGYIIQG